MSLFYSQQRDNTILAHETSNQMAYLPHFLSLPPELRDQIYIHHFLSLPPLSLAAPQPLICLTSKQIRFESLPLFYTHATFRVVPNTSHTLTSLREPLRGCCLGRESARALEDLPGELVARIEKVHSMLPVPGSGYCVLDLAGEGHVRLMFPMNKLVSQSDMEVAVLGERALKRVIRVICTREGPHRVRREDFAAFADALAGVKRALPKVAS